MIPYVDNELCREPNQLPEYSWYELQLLLYVDFNVF